MRYIATILTLLISLDASGQGIKKALKFATFYTAFSGGNSLSDREVFSVANGLQTDVIELRSTTLLLRASARSPASDMRTERTHSTTGQRSHTVTPPP